LKGEKLGGGPGPQWKGEGSKKKSRKEKFSPASQKDYKGTTLFMALFGELGKRGNEMSDEWERGPIEEQGA